jgi:fumarate hydratase class II
MPGKVNPTQCESIMMVCSQVMGLDHTIAFCASQGNFELNTFMPVMIHDFINQINLLNDSINSFNKNCLIGIKPNLTKIK